MKKGRHRQIPLLLFIAASLAAGNALGQGSLIAIGEVSNGSFLSPSMSPIGATITVVPVATGTRNITVAATGAFAGAAESDFVIQLTDSVPATSDSALAAEVFSVTPDLLTVKVRSMDVAVANPPDIAVAEDINFAFAIHRTDGLTNGSPLDSPYILASGSVNLNGGLVSGFGVDGHSIITGKTETGRYFINVVKAGAMAADSASDYILFLSTTSNALPDVGIRGSVFSTFSEDFAHFKVATDDVQSATPSNGVFAADAPFAFLIYRIAPAESVASPRSKLLAAMATVNGTSGALVSAKAGFPGVTISSLRVSEGFYRIFFDAPGAFAGVDADRYVPLVSMHSVNTIDEIVKAKTIVVNDNRMRVDVTVDDVQHNGDADGIPSDGTFFLTLYDVAPPMSQDLSVGPKATGAGARGRGIMNGSGVGQALNLPLKGRKPRTVFYRSVNSGLSIDNLRVRSLGTSPKLAVQFFATTGTRRNVTALAKSGSVIETGLLPGDSRGLQALIRYKSVKKRRNAVVALRSVSDYDPTGQDLNLVKTKPK